MEPTIRSIRIEPTTGSVFARSLPATDDYPVRQLIQFRPQKRRHRERNFWMQRPGAKNPPARHFIIVRERELKNRRQESPQKRPPFRSVTVSAVREDCVVGAPGLEPGTR